jgi:hypothetical protein
VVAGTDVLLAQALHNKEDSTAARVSSLKLCFIFILSILLGSVTGICKQFYPTKSAAVRREPTAALV